jgi:hypothetical protein
VVLVPFVSCMKFFGFRVEILQTQCMTHCIVLAQQEVQRQTSVRRRKGCYKEQTGTVSILLETQEIVFSLLESLLDFTKNTKLQCQTLHQIFALSLLHCSSFVPRHISATQAYFILFVLFFHVFTASYILIVRILSALFDSNLLFLCILSGFHFCVPYFVHHVLR